MFDYLTIACTSLPPFFSYELSTDAIHLADFSALPAPSEDSTYPAISTCFFPQAFCSLTATPRSAFVFAVACWATLQLTWTFILLLSQLWQITRQLTTFEVSNIGRYGFMGGKGGSSLATQQGHQHQLQLQDGGEDEVGGITGHAHAGHNHKHTRMGSGCTGFLMQILGLDRFTKGKAADGLAKASRTTNPFDSGIIGNCVDFWTKGRELEVEYERLYDVPSEGLVAAKRKRKSERGDDGHGKSRLGALLGQRMAGGAGREYQPLSMEEEV
jgi:hypothetical protein